MKLLVTGRSGQVSRSLAEAASLHDDLNIVSAARPQCDLRDSASVAAAIAAHRPDIVINAAAYTQVDQAENDEATAFAVNAEGAAHLARACAAHDLPLIHLSTDYVFDGEKSTPYTEDDPTGPINAYGRSKLAGEIAVRERCERHLIVRTSWVHSPFGSNFVRTMLRLAATRPSIDVVSDQIGCPTYAPHLADALLTMARAATVHSARTVWGTYHAAGQGETSWFGFATEIFQFAKSHGLASVCVSPIASRDYPTAAARPMNSRLNCNLLSAAFDVALPHWSDGAAACVERLSRLSG